MLKQISLFYLVTCAVAAVFGALQSSTGIDPNVIQLTQLGPLFGAGVVLICYGKASRPINAESSKGAFWRIAASVVLPLIAFGLALVFCLADRGTSAIAYLSPHLITKSPFWLVIIAAFVGAACEELGWRCWLQPFLRRRFSILRSSVTTGLLWGLWHVGVFASGPFFTGLFIVSSVSISICLGHITDRSTTIQRLIPAMTLHALTNIYLLLFFKEESGNIFAMTVITAGWLLCAMLATRFAGKLVSSTSPIQS